MTISEIKDSREGVIQSISEISILILHTDMEGGHGGKSDRYYFFQKEGAKRTSTV
jgi:hypothetical protein